MSKKETIAIVLSAGSGSRMNSDIPKQYLELNDKPVICHTLNAFEESNVDGIILVYAKEYIEYCKEDIVKKYGYKKVLSVIEGGKERYDSVYNGLKQCDSKYVLVHDGARSCISKEIINRNIDEVIKHGAVVTGVKTKDTVKVCDDEGVIMDTPNRDDLWIVQTPQTFDTSILISSYEKMMADDKKNNITDDSMVVEKYGEIPVVMIEGSYKNIKITTVEDMKIAEVFLKEK